MRINWKREVKEIKQNGTLPKPCPFCGGSPRLTVFTSMAWVCCESCGAVTRGVALSVNYCAKDEAFKLWNNRVADKKEM